MWNIYVERKQIFESITYFYYYCQNNKALSLNLNSTRNSVIQGNKRQFFCWSIPSNDMRIRAYKSDDRFFGKSLFLWKCTNVWNSWVADDKARSDDETACYLINTQQSTTSYRLPRNMPRVIPLYFFYIFPCFCSINFQPNPHKSANWACLVYFRIYIHIKRKIKFSW